MLSERLLISGRRLVPRIFPANAATSQSQPWTLDEAMPLKSVKFSKASLGALTDNPRYKQDALTHIVYIKGTVYVAALSNEQFSSSLRAIPFPFTDKSVASGIEIFHGAHGKLETKSPIRTFVRASAHASSPTSRSARRRSG